MIRTLAAHGTPHTGAWPALRILLAAGEVLDPDHFVWYASAFGDGNLPVINYSGGTEVSGGQQALTSVLFLLFVGATLAITIWAGRQTKTAADFYAGGRGFSGVQNGVAIGGDYMSAASFLGIAGIIALYGYDGFLYSIGFLVAWLVALLLVAELMRNSGKFTMGDVLAFRMRQRPVRAAAGVSTNVVSI